ncbi:hypothetical protein B0H13DRAFT_1901525 [Mycena leptocephala]|nr:hypothetical protein B0H13DRAFT_1901525 [Mycena leptocephala]
MPSTFDESKLPINWGKNSLQFDGQQPEELRKFLTSLETIFVTSKATTDAEKKFVALRYCSGSTKDEWESMVTARDPYSWEDFKEEMPIQADDVSAYQHFYVASELESISFSNQNCETLHETLGSRIPTGNQKCYEDDALEALPSYKADKVLWEAVAANKGLPFVPEARDDDDKYVWTDMVAAATHIVDEESSSFFESVSSSAKNCRKRHDDIDKGIVKVVDGKTLFFDGKTIPREPRHISALDKARDYHERRHVSQNYDELMDHYFGEEPSAEYDSKPDEYAR